MNSRLLRIGLTLAGILAVGCNPNGLKNTPDGGDGTDNGGTVTTDGGDCAALNCDPKCPSGIALDPNGCPTCSCASVCRNDCDCPGTQVCNVDHNRGGSCIAPSSAVAKSCGGTCVTCQPPPPGCYTRGADCHSCGQMICDHPDGGGPQCEKDCDCPGSDVCIFPMPCDPAGPNAGCPPQEGPHCGPSGPRGHNPKHCEPTDGGNCDYCVATCRGDTDCGDGMSCIHKRCGPGCGVDAESTWCQPSNGGGAWCKDDCGCPDDETCDPLSGHCVNWMNRQNQCGDSDGGSCVACPPPQPGCYYAGGDCGSCGKLVCSSGCKSDCDCGAETTCNAGQCMMSNRLNNCGGGSCKDDCGCPPDQTCDTTQYKCTNTMDRQNQCGACMKDGDCGPKQVCAFACGGTGGSTTSGSGTTGGGSGSCSGPGRCVPSDPGGTTGGTGCICPHDYAPVCGGDGRTYTNGCEANCARAPVKHDGACGAVCNQSSSCPPHTKCAPAQFGPGECVSDGTCVTPTDCQTLGTPGCAGSWSCTSGKCAFACGT